MAVDPECQFLSRYSYTGNGINPILGKDPDGKEIIVVNEGNNTYKVIDNKQNYDPRVIYNGKTIAIMNDPRPFYEGNVDKGLQYPRGSKIYMNYNQSESYKRQMASIPERPWKPLAYAYTTVFSTLGPMDFSNRLPRLPAGEDRVGPEIGQLKFKPSHAGYVMDNILYNPMDAGNFGWGEAMKKLGFSFEETVGGSQTFNRLIYQEYDEAYDQFAIIRGYYSQDKVFHYEQDEHVSIYPWHDGWKQELQFAPLGNFDE